MLPYLQINIHNCIKRLDPIQSGSSELPPESFRISNALLIKFIPVGSNMVELRWNVVLCEEKGRTTTQNGGNPRREEFSSNEKTRHVFVAELGGWLLSDNT